MPTRRRPRQPEVESSRVKSISDAGHGLESSNSTTGDVSSDTGSSRGNVARLARGASRDGLAEGEAFAGNTVGGRGDVAVRYRVSVAYPSELGLLPPYSGRAQVRSR